MALRSFLVGRPNPAGRTNTGCWLCSFSFSYSEAGVWSSACCGTSLAPTRLSITPTTFRVLVMIPIFIAMTSLARISRDGLIACPRIWTWPALQASDARVLVLKTRTAQSHLSILTASILQEFYPFRHPMKAHVRFRMNKTASLLADKAH